MEYKYNDISVSDDKDNVLEMKKFVYLMLAMLAKNSKIIDLKDSDRKIVPLPVNYKQIIENILCADNGWKDEFSILIDTEEYFEDHFGWEFRLSTTLKQVLSDLKKDFRYDFENDRLLIDFTTDEINSIISNYEDKNLLDVMEHFTYLLVDYIYTRSFQERFHDYSASAVKKMHDRLMNEINGVTEESNLVKQKKRVLFLKKK